MSLITPEFEKLFQKYPLRSQEKTQDPLVVACIYNPTNAQTWYLTEYDSLQKLAFGYVAGVPFPALGYISLTKLDEIRIPELNLPLERDLSFRPCPLSHCVPELFVGEVV